VHLGLCLSSEIVEASCVLIPGSLFLPMYLSSIYINSNSEGKGMLAGHPRLRRSFCAHSFQIHVPMGHRYMGLPTYRLRVQVTDLLEKI
jgi:hypothetical protein